MKRIIATLLLIFIGSSLTYNIKKILKTKKRKILTTFIILLGLFSISNTKPINKQLVYNREELKIEDTLKQIDEDTNEFSIINFVRYLDEINMPHPEVAFAIAKQESGFCSKLFITNNNLFGMRHPRVRETTSLGKKNNFAYYSDWKSSVYDYYLYVTYANGHNKTRNQYLRYIDNVYASSGYSDCITKHFPAYYKIYDSQDLDKMD